MQKNLLFLKSLFHSKIELPSNRKFGLSFTIIFLVSGFYFFYYDSIKLFYLLTSLGVLFLSISLIKSDILYPLNKIWMSFGYLLGMIVSPIVLGIIFFGLFAPISFIMLLFKRDELKLKLIKKQSHWIIYNSLYDKNDAFKKQF